MATHPISHDPTPRPPQHPSFREWILQPEEALLQEKVIAAQLHLGKAALAEGSPLVTTVFYPGLGEKLLRARQFEELADAMEQAQLDVLLPNGNPGQRPEPASFRERLSQGTARLLERIGGAISHSGLRVEARQCRKKAEELYTEVGALLALEYLIHGNEPRWAMPFMIDLRAYSTEMASREWRRTHDPRLAALRERIAELHGDYVDVLTRDYYATALEDEESAARRDVILFTAWGVHTYGSLGSFLMVLGRTAFNETGAWGNVLVSSVLHVLLKYRAEVRDLAEFMPDTQFGAEPMLHQP